MKDDTEKLKFPDHFGDYKENSRNKFNAEVNDFCKDASAIY